MLADDIAGFMQVLGIEKAHIAGISLGAATALKFAVKYPDKVKSLSIHSGWSKTDIFIKILVNGWMEIAKFKGSVVDTVISFIFPLCLSPELFVKNPDYIKSLSDFVKSRPEQPTEAFVSQCLAVLSHDCELQLSNIKAPTLLTFGGIDLITSIGRFGNHMKNSIKNSELVVFEGCAHTPMYEKTEDFNKKTLYFLKRHIG
jgi:3-oxoadipate enol-lactonase